MHVFVISCYKHYSVIATVAERIAIMPLIHLSSVSALAVDLTGVTEVYVSQAQTLSLPVEYKNGSYQVSIIPSSRAPHLSKVDVLGR